MYTIEIRKVTGSESELVIGCEFLSKEVAIKTFKQLEQYAVTPKYGIGDYLIDLHIGQDLMETIITTAEGASEIDKWYFGQ